MIMKKKRSFLAARLRMVVVALGAALGLFASFAGQAPRSAAAPQATEQGIQWKEWSAKTFEQAGQSNMLVVMDVYAEWCGPCKLMDRTTFADGNVQRAMEQFVPVRVDADRQKDVTFAYQIQGLPTTIVLDAAKRMIARRSGYMAPAQFISFVAGARQKLSDAQGAVREATQKPKDGSRAFAAAQKLFEIQRFSEAAPWFRRAVEHLEVGTDHHIRARVGWAVCLLALSDFEEAVGELESLLQEFPDHDLAPAMRRTLPQALFLWAREEQAAGGEHKKADNLYRRLVEKFPDSQLAELARQQMRGQPPGAKGPGNPGRTAPALQVSEWIKGHPTTLDELKRKVVLLDFFQIICPGCRRVHPHIVEMQKKYGDQGLQVLGIAVAFEVQSIQTKPDIREYVKRTEFNYPVAIDADFTTTFRAYGARGTPWVALIDRSGRLRHVDFYEPATVARKIELLLQEKDD